MIHKRTLFLMMVFSSAAAFFLCFSQRFDFSAAATREEMPITAKNIRKSEVKRSAEVKKKSPAVFQWQFLPLDGSYVTSHDRSVNGLAVGYYIPQKEINGVSMALIHAYNERKNGFSMSFLEYSGISNGVSLFFAGGAQSNRGFAMGLWNMTESNNGFQLGLVNQEEKDLLMEYGMKPKLDRNKFGVQAGFINFSDTNGFQFGLLNNNNNPDYDKSKNPVASATPDKTGGKKNNFGVQAGLINYSNTPGIQFGLWNTNPNGLIKHFPLFNINF
jgi:hypothetical protein